MKPATPSGSRHAGPQLLVVGAALLCWLALSFPISAPAQRPQRARHERAHRVVHELAPGSGDWLIAQLLQTQWLSSHADWKAKHPAAECRQFHGDGSALFIVDLWTYRCTTAHASGRVNRFFYMLGDSNPAANDLRQFSAEILQTPNLPISVMQRLHDQIETRLTRLYGAPERPDALPPGVAAFGSADWRLICIWHLPERVLYLYLRQSPDQPIAVGVLARDRTLETASNAEGTRLLLDEQPTAAFEDQVDNRLATALAKSDPRAASLLGETSDTSDSGDVDVSGSGGQPDAGTIFKAITSLIDRAKSAPPAQRAAFLLAADRLGDQWPLPPTPNPPADFQRQGIRLADAGMHFHWDSLGSSWVYQHDLLWTVWRLAPDNEWGQDAFFFLLEHGWDTSGVCHDGADQFRKVIEQGEQFLRQFPESPARLPVQFLIAQAYETWWSLSQWSACSPVTDLGTKPCGPAPGSAAYRAGAEEARAKAIEIYRSLAAADPQTYGTAWLGSHIARLQAGIDTNQRRFYCLYD